jgi:hypothetical protein
MSRVLTLIGSEKQDVGKSKEIEEGAVNGTKAESSRARLCAHGHLLPTRLPSAKAGDEHPPAPERGFFTAGLTTFSVKCL